MSNEVAAWGVIFDLTETKHGMLKVRNTEKRVEEVTAKIAETISSKFLTAGEAATLKGRLGFAEGQLFGRTARRLINDLGSFALAARGRSVITDELRESLGAVSRMLVEARPREINTESHAVMHLYTDASYSPEDESGGLGDVLCTADGTVVAWFGESLDSQFCRKLRAEGQTQLICELEALAVLVALRLWSSEVSSKHLVIFVDNEGSKYAILRGYSKNEALSKIVTRVAAAEDAATTFCWYARVPSEANPSDKPSRGEPCSSAPEGSRVRVERSVLEAATA
jgi:hypothetical protein